jgi:glycosyltransferase involved in cell wall biosynthesis
VEINIFGEAPGPLPFAATIHGLVSPAELGDLYKRCVGGLVISATNVSLVPHEMLAAGCIPVVNDAGHNRLVLDNDHVIYADATPFGLARALSGLTSQEPKQRMSRARAAADSVESVTWERSGEQVDRALQGVVLSAQAGALAA